MSGELVECKKAHGEKAMPWVGIIDGGCLPVVWIDGSVNREVYLEKVLKNTVWQNVKHVATRKEYCFQQDGASCHVTAQYFVIFAIESSLATRNIIGHHVLQTFHHLAIIFGANVRNM